MANFITISRILLAFVALALLFHPTEANYWWAIVLTILVIWGDGLDGFVARKFNLTSSASTKVDALFVCKNLKNVKIVKKKTQPLAIIDLTKRRLKVIITVRRK